MVVLHQTTTESKCDTPKFKKAKKLKLSAETEETSKLTSGDLQHLLLLEQIKLTRLQGSTGTNCDRRIKTKNKTTETNGV